MQIASIHDLKHLLPANDYLVSGQNYQSDDLRPVDVTSPDHMSLHGIYLTRPENIGHAVWSAAIDRRTLARPDLEYHSPQAKDDLVGCADVYSTVAEEAELLLERAFLYFLDPIPDLSIVDIAQWSPIGKYKALRSLGFELSEIEHNGRLVKVFALNRALSLLIRVNEWQLVAINLPMVPVIVAELLPSFMAELRERINILSSQPESFANQNPAMSPSTPAA
ncbi:MAG: hypothetical protein ACYC44_01350 [Patescibacteria group bacterium]